MNIKITARHFRAHESLREQAEAGIENLTKYYDGIINAEVILSFEKVKDSIKIAEITLGVNGKTLKAIAKSEEYGKSIELALVKIETQLKKYKAKIRNVKPHKIDKSEE
jgi:putative sigma-54 modulation protein